jgi:peptide/nickel transport system substrate-binding protein
VTGDVRATLGPTHDVARARAELDALGWRDGDGDGVRERRGERLAFRILVPTTSEPRRRMAVLLQAQLAEVGAAVEVDAADPAAFNDAIRRGRWDALLNVWHSDPNPPGILQAWGAPAAGGRGGANASGWSDPTFEALIDSGAVSTDAARAQGYFARAYARIADEAPALWLYEPVNVMGLARRIRPAPMRVDAWWANLADWHIPAAERTDRDRLGAIAGGATAAAGGAARTP